MPSLPGDSDPEDLPLPVRSAAPFGIGVAAGLLLRFVFSGDSDDPLSAMSGAFIFGAPLIVGAVTIFIAERIERRGWGYYAASGALAALLFVLGAVLILIEGLICAVLASPLFAALGALGGLVMGAACRLIRRSHRTLQAFAALPFALLAFEANTEVPVSLRTIERSALIEASPAAVWTHLRNIRHIQQDELEGAWAFGIGVPRPLAGETAGASSEVRRVRMGKRVYFDQIVEEARENEYIRWRYRFYEDSFPPHALDDHVKIGGRYFDLTDTSYTLTREGSKTRLTLRLHYRLSTRFNWYAGPMLDLMLADAADAYLQLYSSRSAADVPDARS